MTGALAAASADVSVGVDLEVDGDGDVDRDETLRFADAVVVTLSAMSIRGNRLRSVLLAGPALVACHSPECL